MPPLHRCPTKQSILSWWSDNNPPGATIPLHTLAKPLMKLLYHQQALALLDKDFSLSKERVELLMSYVRFKYVSVSTKLQILRYLSVRAEVLLDARAVLDGEGIAVDLLSSMQDGRILRETCSVLAHICSHSALVPLVADLKPIPSLVLLLRSMDEVVQQYAILALCQFLRFSHASAKEAVAVGVLDCMGSLLDDIDSSVVAWTCRMLGLLLRHKDTVLIDAVIQLGPCIKLVSLLDHSSAEVRCHAIYAVSRLSEWSVASVVDANILANVKSLLDSRDPYVLLCTCCLLGMIERYRPGIISEGFQDQLKRLFASEVESENVLIRLSTTYALGYWGCETRGDFGMIPDLELDSDKPDLRSLCFKII
ncbi:armadillo-type protein [Mycena polygramma]|nr:armadillo-type protein [Mycena polygramma]